jgi:hypothetical protein
MISHKPYPITDPELQMTSWTLCTVWGRRHLIQALHDVSKLCYTAFGWSVVTILMHLFIFHHKKLWAVMITIKAKTSCIPKLVRTSHLNTTVQPTLQTSSRPCTNVSDSRQCPTQYCYIKTTVRQLQTIIRRAYYVVTIKSAHKIILYPSTRH